MNEQEFDYDIALQDGRAGTVQWFCTIDGALVFNQLRLSSSVATENGVPVRRVRVTGTDPDGIDAHMLSKRASGEDIWVRIQHTGSPSQCHFPARLVEMSIKNDRFDWLLESVRPTGIEIQ